MLQAKSHSNSLRNKYLVFDCLLDKFYSDFWITTRRLDLYKGLRIYVSLEVPHNRCTQTMTAKWIAILEVSGFTLPWLYNTFGYTETIYEYSQIDSISVSGKATEIKDTNCLDNYRVGLSRGSIMWEVWLICTARSRLSDYCLLRKVTDCYRQWQSVPT